MHTYYNQPQVLLDDLLSLLQGTPVGTLFLLKGHYQEHFLCAVLGTI